MLYEDVVNLYQNDTNKYLYHPEALSHVDGDTLGKTISAAFVIEDTADFSNTKTAIEVRLCLQSFGYYTH